MFLCLSNVHIYLSIYYIYIIGILRISLIHLVKTHSFLDSHQWIRTNYSACCCQATCFFAREISGVCLSHPVTLFPGTVHVHRHTRKSWCRRRSKLFVSNSRLVYSCFIHIAFGHMFQKIWNRMKWCIHAGSCRYISWLNLKAILDCCSESRSEALGLKPKKLLLAKKQMNEESCESFDFRHFMSLNPMTVPTSLINDPQMWLKQRHKPSHSHHNFYRCPRAKCL